MGIWYHTFRGVVFTPSKPFWARKKKYLSLTFPSTTEYVRPNKIGGRHLPNVSCQSQGLKPMKINIILNILFCDVNNSIFQ